MESKNILENIKCRIQDYKNNKLVLEDLAKIFNIPIDKSRRYDYIVKNVDENNLEVEILDKRVGLLYTSKYQISLDNSDEVHNVIYTNLFDSRITYVYKESSLGVNTVIDFINKNNCIQLSRENNLDVTSKNGKRKFTISYFQESDLQRKEIMQKSYEEKLENGQVASQASVERVLGFNTKLFDKYTHVRNNYVVYGINNLKENDVCSEFCGLCIENNNYINKSEFPKNMNHQSYIRLNDKNLKSTMIFKGKTEDNYFHSFDIYKTGENIYISYYSKGSNNENYQVSGTASKSIVLKSLNIGTITPEEIVYIIEILQKEFTNNLFINLVIDELKEFKFKIELNKLVIKQEDMFSPESLINMDDYLTWIKISSQLTDYFTLLNDYLKYSSNQSKQRLLKRN